MKEYLEIQKPELGCILMLSYLGLPRSYFGSYVRPVWKHTALRIIKARGCSLSRVS